MKKSKFLSVKRCLDIAYHSSPWLFIINIISTLALGILSGINIYSIAVLVNGIQVAIVKGGGIKRPFIIFSMVNVGFILLSSIQSYTHQKLVLKTNYYLDYKFIEQCKHIQLKDFETEETYDLITRANNLGKEKVMQTQFHVFRLIESIISIITVISIILKFNNLIWTVILIVPIISTVTNMKLGKYSYRIERMNITNNRKADYINYLLTNNIAIKEIISFNIGDYLLNKFNKSMEEVIHANEKVINGYTLNNLILGILEVAIKLWLVIKTVLLSINNKGLIGDVMGFIYLLDLIESRFKSTFRIVSNYWDSIIPVYYIFINIV